MYETFAGLEGYQEDYLSAVQGVRQAGYDLMAFAERDSGPSVMDMLRKYQDMEDRINSLETGSATVNDTIQFTNDAYIFASMAQNLIKRGPQPQAAAPATAAKAPGSNSGSGTDPFGLFSLNPFAAAPSAAPGAPKGSSPTNWPLILFGVAATGGAAWYFFGDKIKAAMKKKSGAFKTAPQAA